MKNDIDPVAVAFQIAARVSRAALFGSDPDAQLPLNLQSDAQVPFLGFCGSRFRVGGVVLVGINPGGGGDAYAERTAQDAELIPLIQSFVAAPPRKCATAFRSMCESYMCQAQTWNLWRILAPTLTACNASIAEVCYINLIPYRTAKDARPISAARHRAWELVAVPLLSQLQPRRIVALGKKAGDVLKGLHRPPPPLFVVPRTIGDSYLSAEAQRVLADMRLAT